MARTITHGGPERSNRLILYGAFGLAALAAVLIFVALSNFGSSGSSDSLGAIVNVVVSSQDIKAGTKITSDMLDIATISSRSQLQGAISDRAAVTGLTTRYPFQKGEQFTTAKLGQTEKDQGFVGVIPAGKRAISIPVTEITSVGGLILAGNHIDITAVLTKGTGTSAVSEASTLLQDVEVLSVAQTAQKSTARLDANGNPITDGSISTAPDNTTAKPSAKSITVAVTPEQVATIALAEEQGKIYLSLRPPGDSGEVAGLDAPRTLPNR